MKEHWLFIFLGCMTLVLGTVSGINWYRSATLVNTGEHAEGTVVSLVYQVSQQSRRGAYYPIIRFKSSDGKEVVQKASFGSDPAQYKVNDVVEVIYNKDDPEAWSLNDWWSLYFMPTMFGVFAVGLGLSTGTAIFCKVRGIHFPGAYKAKR